MNRNTDQLRHSLLEEVFPPALAARSLAETLREVNRRRRWRELRQQGGILAMLTALLGWTALQWPRSPTEPALPAAPPASRSIRVVATRPLPASMVVRTDSRATARLGWVRTSSGVTAVVESGPAWGAWVETDAEPHRAQELTDDELLALVAGRPAALVRSGDEARLVLAGLEAGTSIQGLAPGSGP